jgi:two-component system cell cycle sensor histidine kinase/response regulator CckA
VLLVEDSPDDARLLQRELSRGGYDLTLQRVETREAMLDALRTQPWDCIVSDYSLPTFSGPEALEVLHETGHDLPFIIVSGTIGEEAAVTALKAGAHDFVLKGRPARLLPAIERELREAGNRAQQRELAERLHQAQKVEVLGQLAAGVAHDFNNILTAMLGFCELLLEDAPEDSPQRNDLLEIQKAGYRASALTRQLLTFSRKQPLQAKVHDLNALVSDMEAMLRRLVRENIRLEVALAPDAGAVRLDVTQLEQVLMNLAVNACDAMPGGGRLYITTSNVSTSDGQSAYTSLAVRDTGVGMSPETAARIFEPFFTTKGVGQGTGLGLATVAGIVKQCGGEIEVQSVPGDGTTFTVRIPRAGHGTSTQEESTAEERLPRGSETILVVEDDLAVRRLACTVLERGGYCVLEAAHPRQATNVAAAHRGRIDLVVSDVILPESEGAPLIDRLRAGRPNLRWLYMSGHAEDAVARHGKTDASAPFLEKPFTSAVLLRKVREILDVGAGVASR